MYVPPTILHTANFRQMWELCSGVEFETHLKGASTFIKQRGSDSTERGFIEQRIDSIIIITLYQLASKLTIQQARHYGRDYKLENAALVA